jgi:LPXTG-motif cell wall-anchored protein
VTSRLAATVAPSAHRSHPLRFAVLALVVFAGSLALTGAIGPTPAHAGPPPFTAFGSTNQVDTSGHNPGDALELWQGSTKVATGTADAQGAYLFGKFDAGPIPAGAGYEVRNTTQSTTVGNLTVMSADVNPPQSFYDAINLGVVPNPGGSTYTYIPTRDGTLLGANITWPKDGSPGPWPVLVDYSGYDPSQPPNPPQEAQMYPYAGYVVVGINLRGTDCAGGAFELFSTIQTLDGYDAIEALATQSWSTGHVGMVGISYMGISQLFVGQTNPPHLDAITPMSTYADFYGGIGYPGGIINSGFFLDWLGQRDSDSNPASHAWVQSRIAGGDTICQANQVMRLQSKKLIPEATPDRYFEDRVASLSPTNFVHKIKVPTFLVGQFQDEQTGGQWPTMISHFDPTTRLRVELTNGTHVEGMGPERLPRAMEFLDFYVKKKIPKIGALLRVGLPPGLAQIFSDTPPQPYTLQLDRFSCYLAVRPPIHPDCTGIPQPAVDNYAGALAAYEAEPPVRIYWENGNGPAPWTAGEPFSSVQASYASWPLPGVTGKAYYFQPDGSLSETAPTIADSEARGASSYAYDPDSKNPKQDFTGGTDQMWAPLPAVNWKPLVEGDSLSFISPAFTKNTAFAGSASADLWVRSTEADTDLEVTLTEVRPDGKETFIQAGWLRASHRKLAAGSTDLLPEHTHLASDAEPLPAGQFDLARVEIFPFAHTIRAGSKLRINVEVPGGDQPFWNVTPMTFGHPVTNDIAHSVGRPSRVVLPIVPDGETPAVPAALPPCPGLRGQACRSYEPARIPTGVTAAVAGHDIDVSWTPPPGATPDHYVITVTPTGQTVTVAGTTTSWSLVDPATGTPFTFTVAAVFGQTTGPASDASLAAQVPTPQATTTTTSTSTTSTSSSTTSTTAPSTTAAPTTTAAAAVEPTTIATGTLPTTGTDEAPWLALAALLLVAGGALVVVSSRSRQA